MLGQSYTTPEDIDEDGLMDELDALELDLEEDLENEIGNGEIPSYLRDDLLPSAGRGEAWGHATTCRTKSQKHLPQM